MFNLVILLKTLAVNLKMARGPPWGPLSHNVDIWVWARTLMAKIHTSGSSPENCHIEKEELWHKINRIEATGLTVTAAKMNLENRRLSGGLYSQDKSECPVLIGGQPFMPCLVRVRKAEWIHKDLAPYPPIRACINWSSQHKIPQ